MDRNKIISESITNIELFYEDLSNLFKKIKSELHKSHGFKDESKVYMLYDSSTSINNPERWSPYFVYSKHKYQDTNDYLLIYVGTKDYFREYEACSKFYITLGYYKNVKNHEEMYWQNVEYLFKEKAKMEIDREKSTIEIPKAHKDFKIEFDSAKIYCEELFNWESNIEKRIADVLSQIM